MSRRLDDRVEDLFDRAIALRGAARGEFLARECAGDPGLVQELESLLTAHDGESGPLDRRDELLTPCGD